MFAIGFVGPSGVGKTTLMEQVLACIKRRGVSVSAVKSAHHNIDVDKPGKDSYRYRQAGAHEVLLVGPERCALMRETPLSIGLTQALAMLTPVDIVLVEGYKSEEGIPRIVVHRKAYEGKPIELPAGVVAVATDDETLAVPAGAVRLDVNDPDAVAQFIIGCKGSL